MSKWRIIWLVIIGVVVTFELWAVISKVPGDTLSEFLWAITRHNAVRFTVAGFLVWLILHIIGGPGRF